ncbi:hypothetical protein HDU99_005093, partial [Rhizoclosmatium hyalinum]
MSATIDPTTGLPAKSNIFGAAATAFNPPPAAMSSMNNVGRTAHAAGTGATGNNYATQIPINKMPEPPQPKVKVVTVLASDGKTGESMEFSYINHKVIGNGSFGVVNHVKILDTTRNGGSMVNLKTCGEEGTISAAIKK